MSARRSVLVCVLACVSLVIPTTSFAQTTAWVHQFGTPEYEEGWGPLVVDSVLYVSGWTAGTLPGEMSAGGGDGFVRAYDLDGNELWTTQFGTSEEDHAWSLASDATGLYVTGFTLGAFEGQTAMGDLDAFVAKLGFDGSLAWVTQFGTHRFDLGSNVVADASGVYVAGGTSGRFPGQEIDGSDAFQARLTSGGVLDWIVQFGGPGAQNGYANVIGTDGIYVNGLTQSDGKPDMFVALFQPDGTISWSKTFGTHENDFTYGLTADASGVYVTGETDGVFSGQVDRRGADAFAMLLSPVGGSTVWRRQFGTSGFDSAFGAMVDGGTLYTVGATTGGFGGQANAGGADGFLQMIDGATGAKISTLQFGTDRDDHVYADWVDGTAAYLVGVTQGTFPGETKSTHSDVLVARIDLA